MSLSNEPTSEPVFDDPALRDVVRRAWGGERAPAGVSDRVCRVFREEPQASAVAAGRWRMGSVRGLAAAAVLLLAVGGVAGYFAGVFREGGAPGPSGPGPAFASRIPPELVTQLAEVHHHCSNAASHHGAASTGTEDFQVIATRLRSHLRRPVLASHPGDPDGAGSWTFCGAAVCQVGRKDAGHLVFVRGKAAVSVFSLEAGVCPQLPANGQCESLGNGCNVAAFRQGEGFFCVVGSSKDESLTRDKVRALRDVLRPNLTAALDAPPFPLSRPPTLTARAALARRDF